VAKSTRDADDALVTSEGAHSVDVDVGDEAVMRTLSGSGNENLRTIGENLDVKVGARGHSIQIVGARSAVVVAERVVQGLARIVKKMDRLSANDVVHAIHAVRADNETDLSSIFLDIVIESRRGRRVTPKGIGQKLYVDAIRTHDVVFGVGPAGTGKTYLAVALAVASLRASKVARIILTRPAVEAGERLGFLPGDLEAKINPYLRPLYDALYDLMEPEEIASLIEKRVIEVAPLAFMRGRTLHDAFVILDEGQNTTASQMKMFLTRLGFGSKMVVTGDLTQMDLPRGTGSGLTQSLRILEGVPGVSQCFLTDADVVRHRLVQRIIQAYDAASFEGGGA
jgi:phosphate starvation-inducible PhoH-like protein